MAVTHPAAGNPRHSGLANRAQKVAEKFALGKWIFQNQALKAEVPKSPGGPCQLPKQRPGSFRARKRVGRAEQPACQKDRRRCTDCHRPVSAQTQTRAASATRRGQELPVSIRRENP